MAQPSKQDLATQRAETFLAFDRIVAEHSMPMRAIVDYQFLPCQASADQPNFLDLLASRGFIAHRYDFDLTVEIHVPMLPMTADNIWQTERELTLIAAQFGYCPDGWGFFEYPDDSTLGSI